MAKVTATAVPDESALQPTLADADFYDAYEAPLSTAMLSPTEIFLRASRSTPRWVDDLMAVRNRIVRLFGLKDVGAMKVAARAPDAYQVGDRLAPAPLGAAAAAHLPRTSYRRLGDQRKDPR